MSGQLALMPAIKRTLDEVMAGPSTEELEGAMVDERKLVANAKKLTLLIAGAASQKYMMGLADQQEIMGAIADMVIETFAMDSAVVRTRKLIEKNGEPQSQLAVAMTQCYLMDAMQKVESAARKVAPAVAEGDMLRSQMAIIRRLAKHEPANTIALRQKIAERVIEAGKYTL